MVDTIKTTFCSLEKGDTETGFKMTLMLNLIKLLLTPVPGNFYYNMHLNKDAICKTDFLGIAD